MSEQLSNFAHYEQDAAEKIARVQGEREQQTAALQEEESRRATIEARRQSPEVQALNDKAEMEIFGSRGRTYVDPETGAILATAEESLPGVVDEIATNRRYGQKEAERQAKATEYIKAIKQLTDEGFELSQAKLIMDKRAVESEKDKVLINKLIALELSKGSTVTEARKIANKRVARRKEAGGTTDTAIKNRIREEGIFTADELEGKSKPMTTREEPVSATAVKPAKEEPREPSEKEPEENEAAPKVAAATEPQSTRRSPSNHDDNGRTVAHAPRIQTKDTDSSPRVHKPRSAFRPAGPPTSKEDLGAGDGDSREKPIATEPAVEESSPTQAPESKGKGSEDASAPANSSAGPAPHEAAETETGAGSAPGAGEAAGGEKKAEEPGEPERLQEILKIPDNHLTREQVELLADAATRVRRIQDAVYNTDTGTIEPRTQYVLETKRGRVPIDEAVVNSLRRFARAAHQQSQPPTGPEDLGHDGPEDNEPNDDDGSDGGVAQPFSPTDINLPGSGRQITVLTPSAKEDEHEDTGEDQQNRTRRQRIAGKLSGALGRIRTLGYDIDVINARDAAYNEGMIPKPWEHGTVGAAPLHSQEELGVLGASDKMIQSGARKMESEANLYAKLAKDIENDDDLSDADRKVELDKVEELFLKRALSFRSFERAARKEFPERLKRVTEGEKQPPSDEDAGSESATRPEDTNAAQEEGMGNTVRDEALDELDHDKNATGLTWESGIDTTYRVVGREGDLYLIERTNHDDNVQQKLRYSADRVRSFLDGRIGASNFRWES